LSIRQSIGGTRGNVTLEKFNENSQFIILQSKNILSSLPGNKNNKSYQYQKNYWALAEHPVEVALGLEQDDSVCDKMMNTLLGDDYAGADAAGPTPAVADFDWFSCVPLLRTADLGQ
jgi:hypothetical protein